MTISINQFKSGLTLLLDGQVFIVVDYHHVKPCKGAAFVRVRVKNLKLGTVLEKTFRGDDKIEEAFVETKRLTYLYKSGDTCYFMDQETFDQLSLPITSMGDQARFLKDNTEVTAMFHANELLSATLPNFIESKVIHTEPGLRGDTAKSTLKAAQIDTGATVQVPLFVEVGDTIKIDTRTGEYLERV